MIKSFREEIYINNVNSDVQGFCKSNCRAAEESLSQQ